MPVGAKLVGVQALKGIEAANAKAGAKLVGVQALKGIEAANAKAAVATEAKAST